MSIPIKTDYRSVTPYLAIKGADKALEFYKRAFGAVARPICLTDPQGRVVHAEMMIGDSILMIGEESLQYAAPSPLTLGGTSVKLAITVDDVDTFVARAVEAGNASGRPVLWRTVGASRGPIWAPMDCRHADRGCFARRNAT